MVLILDVQHPLREPAVPRILIADNETRYHTFGQTSARVSMPPVRRSGLKIKHEP